MGSPEIVHNADHKRFELVLDGEVIGKTYYRADRERRVFFHTEVDEAHQGKGLAGQLIEAAVTETRDAGFRLVPQCPAVDKWLQKHPEFDSIVEHDAQA